MKRGVKGTKMETILFLMFYEVTNNKQNAQICHAETLLELLTQGPAVETVNIFWKS
jgi:hypothetical protein